MQSPLGWGVQSTEATCISFERARLLSVFILPRMVRSMDLQIFSVFYNLSSFSSKLHLSLFTLSYEKYTPRARTGFSDHLKPKGLSLRSFHFLSHRASVLLLLISRPDMPENA